VDDAVLHGGQPCRESHHLPAWARDKSPISVTFTTLVRRPSNFVACREDQLLDVMPTWPPGVGTPAQNGRPVLLAQCFALCQQLPRSARKARRRLEYSDSASGALTERWSLVELPRGAGGQRLREDHVAVVASRRASRRRRGLLLI
jgi:hypothetical protein